jgi:hypothetical protein
MGWHCRSVCWSEAYRMLFLFLWLIKNIIDRGMYLTVVYSSFSGQLNLKYSNTPSRKLKVIVLLINIMLQLLL